MQIRSQINNAYFRSEKIQKSEQKNAHSTIISASSFLSALRPSSSIVKKVALQIKSASKLHILDQRMIENLSRKTRILLSLLLNLFCLFSNLLLLLLDSNYSLYRRSHCTLNLSWKSHILNQRKIREVSQKTSSLSYNQSSLLCLFCLLLDSNCKSNHISHCMRNSLSNSTLLNSNCRSHCRWVLERRSFNYFHISIIFSINILSVMYVAYVMISTYRIMLCMIICEHQVIEQCN